METKIKFDCSLPELPQIKVQLLTLATCAQERLLKNSSLCLNYDYEFDVVLSSATAIAPSIFISKKCTITSFWQKKNFHVEGLVSRVQGPKTENEHFTYAIKLHSPWHALKHTIHNRSFAEISVIDIIKSMLQPYARYFHVEWRVRNNPVDKISRIQWQMSDYHFIIDLMNEWGLLSYFTFRNDCPTLVIHNHIADFILIEEFTSSTTPPVLSRKLTTDHSIHSNQQDEDALVPQVIVTKNQTESFGLGTEYIIGKSNSTPQPGAHLAQIHQGYLDAQRITLSTEGTHPESWPGRSVVLGNNGAPGVNYLIESLFIQIDCRAAMGLSSHAFAYTSQITLKPYTLNYMPAKPGPQPPLPVTTARVVAHATHSGYLQYRLHYDFDREPSTRQERSALAQCLEWGGGTHEAGTHFPHSVGTHVAITFVDNNPHYPIILGALCAFAVPNPVTKTNARQNRFKTSHTEWLLDDTPGDERILLTTHQGPSLGLFADDKTPALALDAASGDLNVGTSKTLTLHSQAHLVSSIKGHYKVKVMGNYQSQSERTLWQAQQSMSLESKEILSIKANKGHLSSQANLVMEAARGHIQSDQGVDVLSQGRLSLSSAGAISLKTSPEGSLVVEANGAKIEFISGKLAITSPEAIYIEAATQCSLFGKLTISL